MAIYIPWNSMEQGQQKQGMYAVDVLWVHACMPHPPTAHTHREEFTRNKLNHLCTVYHADICQLPEGRAGAKEATELDPIIDPLIGKLDAVSKPVVVARQLVFCSFLPFLDPPFTAALLIGLFGCA